MHIQVILKGLFATSQNIQTSLSQNFLCVSGGTRILDFKNQVFYKYCFLLQVVLIFLNDYRYKTS